MKRVLLTAILTLTSFAAQADPIPSYVLDKDYQSCMGGEDPNKDPQRSQYCNCIRDAMSHWDLETYGNLAMQESKAPQGTPPPQIEELAKTCIEHVLH